MSKKLRVLLIPLFAVVYSIYTSFVFIKVGDANAVFFDSAILILYLLSTVIYLLRYSEFTYLGFLSSLCEIVVYVQMSEQRILLENGIDAALIRRDVGNVLALEHDLALIRILKAADNSKGCCLTAA